MSPAWMFWHRLGLRLDRAQHQLTAKGERDGLTAIEFRRLRRLEWLEYRRRRIIDRVAARDRNA